MVGRRKIGLKVFAGVIVVALFATSLIGYNYISERPGERNVVPDDVESQNGGVLMNFSINPGLQLPARVPIHYMEYSILRPEYSSESANRTITDIFGAEVVSATERYDNYEKNAFDYWVHGGIYGIRSDNVIFYFNHEDHDLYLKKDIEINPDLFDEEQSEGIASQYISERVGKASSEFVLQDSRTSEVVASDGAYVKSYKYTYTRNIDGLPVWSNSAGSIHISISPTGDVLSFMLSYPTLEEREVRTPLEPIAAVHHVDDNFKAYKLYLYAGYYDVELVDIQSSYGIQDDVLAIGWTLYFMSTSRPDLISEVFVS